MKRIYVQVGYDSKNLFKEQKVYFDEKVYE